MILDKIHYGFMVSPFTFFVLAATGVSLQQYSRLMGKSDSFMEMTSNKIIIVLLLLLLPFCWMACSKTAGLPPEPVLTYLQVEPQTDPATLNILFGYQDGDGNLGITQADTFPPFNFGSPYFYNLYVEYFEKINGSFRKVTINDPDPGEPLDFNTRFGRLLAAEYEPQPIEGELKYDIPLTPAPIVSDTVKFKIWIYDRALNKSNTLETEEIILK